MNNILLVSPDTPAQWQQYYQFRWRYLRQPLQLPQGSEQDEYEAASFHICAQTATQQIIGVGRITPEANNVMRIRYMAVDKNQRRIGLGSMIMQRLLAYAEQQHAQVCWLNARLDAQAFYCQNGFIPTAATHTELGIAHVRMHRQLVG